MNIPKPSLEIMTCDLGDSFDNIYCSELLTVDKENACGISGSTGVSDEHVIIESEINDKEIACGNSESVVGSDEHVIIESEINDKEIDKENVCIDKGNVCGNTGGIDKGNVSGEKESSVGPVNFTSVMINACMNAKCVTARYVNFKKNKLIIEGLTIDM